MDTTKLDAISRQRFVNIAAQADPREGICQGLEDLSKGRTRPACDVFDEIRREHGIVGSAEAGPKGAPQAVGLPPLIRREDPIRGRLQRDVECRSWGLAPTAARSAGRSLARATAEWIMRASGK